MKNTIQMDWITCEKARFLFTLLEEYSVNLQIELRMPERNSGFFSIIDSVVRLVASPGEGISGNEIIVEFQDDVEMEFHSDVDSFNAALVDGQLEMIIDNGINTFISSDVLPENVQKEIIEILGSNDHLYKLDRESDDFLKTLDGFLFELGNGKVVKHFEAPSLGQYHLLVGYPESCIAANK